MTATEVCEYLGITEQVRETIQAGAAKQDPRWWTVEMVTANFLPDPAFFELAESLEWRPWPCLAPPELAPDTPEVMEAAVWPVGGFLLRAYMDADRTRAIAAVDLAALLDAAEAECSV
jgi:hypothetical protein